MGRTQITDHLGNEYESKTAMFLAYGIAQSTYDNRIRRGWTQEEALTVPVGKNGCKHLESLTPEDRLKRRRLRQQTYYKTNSDVLRSRRKVYRDTHKDDIRERRKANYQANKEKFAERNKAYYDAHKEELNAYRRAYYAEHKAEENAKSRAYYAKRKAELQKSQ